MLAASKARNATSGGWCLVVLMIWLGLQVATAQPLGALPAPGIFGYRHLVVLFGRDSVDVLVLSQKGEEAVCKPPLLWAQGSAAHAVGPVRPAGGLLSVPVLPQRGAGHLPLGHQ